MEHAAGSPGPPAPHDRFPPLLMSTLYKTMLTLLALTTLGCGLLAGGAWYTHFQWLENDGYSRNSFPMESFAERTTWWTAGCLAVTVIATGLFVRSNRSD